MSNIAGSATPSVVGHPISHISYQVQDIPSAVDTWVEVFGAGPFFLLEHIAFERVEHFDDLHPRGAPAVWDHSAAFGQWGPIAVELQQIHTIAPTRTLGPKIVGRGTAPNHVAYIAEDPEGESARLQGLGLPKFLFATFGPVEITFHDVPMFGHAIEVHRKCDFIVSFFETIADAADGWNGDEPLRSLPDGS